MCALQAARSGALLPLISFAEALSADIMPLRLTVATHARLMLLECSPLCLLHHSTCAAGSTRWGEAKELLSSDVRFQNVQEDRVREEIFMEFTEELRKRDR